MIKLRKLKMKDAEGMLEWMHDPLVQKQFKASMADKTRKNVLDFIQNSNTQPINGGTIHYAIADEADTYLGTISLKGISLTDKHAEYAISLRRCAQGHGVGYEATLKLLQIAFEQFNLERVYLNVLSENTSAIHLYEKCGFSLEGEFRNHLFLRGEYRTLKWYGILKEDYEKYSKQQLSLESEDESR